MTRFQLEKTGMPAPPNASAIKYFITISDIEFFMPDDICTHEKCLKISRTPPKMRDFPSISLIKRRLLVDDAFLFSL